MRQMKSDEEKEYELAGDNFSIGAIIWVFVGLQLSIED